jgi:hypothetical protein
MKRLFFGAGVVILTACSATSAQQARRPAQSDVVATVGTTSITLAEVDDKALQQPAGNYGGEKLLQALYEARRSALDEIVADTLMDAAAKAAGIDRAALVEKEITRRWRRSPSRRSRRGTRRISRACRAPRSIR